MDDQDKKISMTNLDDHPPQTNRTIYQWSEPSKTEKENLLTKTSEWTHLVRNRMRQKGGEIQAFRSFERGEEKWCKEHIQQKETNPISEEDNPEREGEFMKMTHSCNTRKGQSRQPIHRTGSSGRVSTKGNL